MGGACCTPAEDVLSNADDYFRDEWYQEDAVTVIEPFMTNDESMSPVRLPKGLNLIITKVSSDRLSVRAYGAGNAEIWEARKTYLVQSRHYDKLELPHEEDSLERKERVDERIGRKRKAPSRSKQKYILSPSEIAERVKLREKSWARMVDEHSRNQHREPLKKDEFVQSHDQPKKKALRIPSMKNDEDCDVGAKSDLLPSWSKVPGERKKGLSNADFMVIDDGVCESRHKKKETPQKSVKIVSPRYVPPPPKRTRIEVTKSPPKGPVVKCPKIRKKKRTSLEDVDFSFDDVSSVEGAAASVDRIVGDSERIIVKRFDGDRQKWGVKVNLGDDLSKWRVLDLQEGGQFAKKGVRKGWKFVKINNFEFEEQNRSMVEIILKEHQKCRITFLDDCGMTGDVAEEPAPPAPVGELSPHEDEFRHEFKAEDTFEEAPEDSERDDVEISDHGPSPSHGNVISSPSAPVNASNSLDDPQEEKKAWQPKGPPLPDRIDTMAHLYPDDAEEHVESDKEPEEDEIRFEDDIEQGESDILEASISNDLVAAGFELGDEYDIVFQAKPFGFSIIEDEYGDNAYIDGVQKDWLDEQGLRMNSQVLEIDGVDVIGMQYGDIIDTMRGAQLPCVIRFRYSMGPDLPPEEDERWEEDDYENRSDRHSDSIDKYDDEGDYRHSPHTSEMLPDEIAGSEDHDPPKRQYREPSSSPRYESSTSARYRDHSTSPLPATRSSEGSDSPKGNALSQDLAMFEETQNDTKSGHIELIEIKPSYQNESESESSPKKTKSGRRRKGKKKKDLTEDSGDERASWARKEGESKSKRLAKGYKENAI